MARNIVIAIVILLSAAGIWYWVIRIPPPDEVLTKVMQGVERVEEADVDLFFNHTTQSFRDKLPIPSDRRDCKVERQKLKNQIFGKGGRFRVSFEDVVVVEANRQAAELTATLGIEFDDAGAWGGYNFKGEWPVTVEMIFDEEVWKIDEFASPDFESWLSGQSWTTYGN